MKQCPVCKAKYADESQSFCLNDGASLLIAPEGEETIVFDRRTNFEIPRATETTKPPSPTKLSSLLIPALIVVVLFVIVGAAGIYFLIPKSWSQPVAVSTSPTPSATPNAASDGETAQLKDKLANLEKRLQEQNKTSPTNANVNSKNPASLNSGGKATARVSSPNDGFLSLRTEPNAKTGAQIVKIPSGASVEIEDCQRSYVTVDSRRGRWCMVTYEGKIGWVFDAWLIY